MRGEITFTDDESDARGTEDEDKDDLFDLDVSH